jgi:hypothetical protein
VVVPLAIIFGFACGYLSHPYVQKERVVVQEVERVTIQREDSSVATWISEQVDCLANRSIGDTNEMNGDDQRNDCFLRISLPDLAGEVITGARLNCIVQTDIGNNSGIDDLYCDRTDAWDETTGGATLAALSFNAPVAENLSADLTVGSTASFNILGDASKGIAKVYADDPTGGPVSLKFTSVFGTGFVDLVETAATIGYVDIGIGALGTRFYPRSHANYWWVEIDHVPAATVGAEHHYKMLRDQ